MKIPVWLKPGVWGAIAGAIAVSIVGFSQLGWKTEGAADQLAQEKATAAVVAALVPYCVLKAQQDPDQAKLAKFGAESSVYSRRDIVTKAGWATLGSDTTADAALARACADRLQAMKAG